MMQDSNIYHGRYPGTRSSQTKLLYVQLMCVPCYLILRQLGALHNYRNTRL
jgi:hypothetical protein